jgi:iron complex outermembrane receptor protein
MLLCVSKAAAQTETKDTVEYVYPTEIVVTAPRMNMPMRELPFSTSVVGSDVIRDLPKSIAVDEAMKLVPGVKVDNQAAGERVHLSIRGQGILTERGIRGIKILLDGIPVNDPTGFAPDFFDVDFAAVDHIEVLRGPAASLYGGSASGGIISIMTQNAVNKPLYAEAQTSYGTNDFWKGFGQFGGNVDKVNYNVSFSRTMGDGYRQHAHFWGNNLYGKVIYAPTEGMQITPIFGYAHIFHENPEGIPLSYYDKDPTLPNDAAIPLNEFLETERTTNGARGHFALTNQHEIDVTAFVKRTLFTESSNGIFNHRTFVSPGASLEYDYTVGGTTNETQNRAAIGVDVQWQKVDQHLDDHRVQPDTLLSNERIKQRGAGVFLVDKITIGKAWSFVGSLRYDDIHNELDDFYFIDGINNSGSANFSKVTGRIGATYSLMQEANLFASWGQGFLPPATEELLLNPDNLGLGGFNPHLTSATSQGVEAGSRGTFKNGVTYDVAFFYLNTDNDFDRYRLPAYPQLTFYKNSGGTHRAGLELYGRYSPIHELDLQLAYTYSHFKYASDSPDRIVMDDPAIVKFIKSGNWLPNSPQHQLYVDAQCRVVPQVSLGFSVEALSKAYIDGANVETEAVKGYALIHARATYRWQSGSTLWELSVNARNIGDTKYVAFSEPDPGGNAYQPGAGREFFGSLKVHL